MNKNIISILIFISTLFVLSCRENDKEFRFGRFDDGFSSGVESIDIEDPIKFIKEDCIENYKEDEIINIVFLDKTASIDDEELSAKGIKIKQDDEGITIENSSDKIIKYILSGNYNGTLKIKNSNSTCIIELNNLNIKSESGPALQITNEKYRTFIVVKESTQNELTDTRILDSSKITNDKKGSLYCKGALIITGETTSSKGGKLTINNAGYKHGIYCSDYLRIHNVDLNVNCNGETSRDCIRTLNAVIIDGGNLNLISKGVITDDEGCGIKVEGEDSNEEKKTVEYTAGAGFIIINNGNINIDVPAKGITAHWKYNETKIGDKEYTETKNKSLLYKTGVVNKNAEKPEPYVVINGGNLKIKTNLKPYETKDASCSPEGIEAKYDLIINGGTIFVDATDDGINAGGAVKINGGKITVSSSENDAIDANGPSGIIINGGEIEASGISVPECAFDCDNNPFVINGGTVIGYGSSNISTPNESSKQNVLVIGGSEYAGKKLSVKQNNKIIFEKEIPEKFVESIILSIPELKAGDFELLKNDESTYSGKITSSITTVNFNGGGFGGFGKGRGFGNKEGMMPRDGQNPPDFGNTPPDFGNAPPDFQDRKNKNKRGI